MPPCRDFMKSVFCTKSAGRQTRKRRPLTLLEVGDVIDV